MNGSASCTTSYWPSPPSTGSPPPATSSSSKATPTASASAPAWVSGLEQQRNGQWRTVRDRKSTRLNSSHVEISYAVFCLKKKKNPHTELRPNKKKTQNKTTK